MTLLNKTKGRVKAAKGIHIARKMRRIGPGNQAATISMIRSGHLTSKVNGSSTLSSKLKRRDREQKN